MPFLRFSVVCRIETDLCPSLSGDNYYVINQSRITIITGYPDIRDLPLRPANNSHCSKLPGEPQLNISKRISGNAF